MRKLVITAILLTMCVAETVSSCPFCPAVSQTIREEMASMDAVVIAQLKETTTNSEDDGANARFRITKVIKGEALIKPDQMIKALCFGSHPEGTLFLMTGVGTEDLMWTTPIKLSERGAYYYSQLLKLPEDQVARLTFFQDYFEDADKALATDSYGEFTRAPYPVIQSLKPKMNRKRLVELVRMKGVPADHRRLYFTMLGVCGTSEDAEMLEGMLRSNNPKDKLGLDALIACYLMLRGDSGMELIEDIYLKNSAAENFDINAALVAIRFHGTEAKVLSKQTLIAAVRHVLDRPEIADLVIADLVQWEDWDSIEKMVQLFREATEKNRFVRVPVINYLRANPRPEAKLRIAELEKVDPEAVQRAQTYFSPAGPPVPKPH